MLMRNFAVLVAALAVLSPGVARAQAPVLTPAQASEQGWAAQRAGQFDRALPLFQRACDANDARGCAGLFLLYGNGDGVALDQRRATAIGNRACEMGHARVCVQLGRWAYDGIGGPRDHTRAASLFARGCEANVAEGCGLLGTMRMNGEGGAADPAAALRLLSGACEGDDPLACRNLALLLVNGPEAMRDAPRARRLLQPLCDGGSAPSCSILGMMLRDGVGGAADPAAAVPLFVRGCDGDQPAACLNLGAAYFDGQGVERDVARARGLFTRACDAGQQVACNNLRRMAPAGAPEAAPSTGAADDRGSPEPRWTTRMGAVTLDGIGFSDVRSTCGMLEVTGVLQALGRATRSCRGGARLSIELRSGRVQRASATPSGAATSCHVRRARSVSVGSLSCLLDVSVGGE